MPLGELLTIAVLTPAQAVLVAADILGSAEASPRGRVRAALRGDGVVEVQDADEEHPGVPMPELMDELVRNARRLPAHPRPHQLWLLHQLEEQVGRSADPAQRATTLREAATEVAGPDAVSRLRHQLAALVEAFNGIAVSRPAAPVRVNGYTGSRPAAVRTRPLPPAPPSAPTQHDQPAQPTQATHSAPPTRPGQAQPPAPPRQPVQVGRRRRRQRMVAVPVVLAVVLVGCGYLFLRGPGSGLLDNLPGGGSHDSRTHRTDNAHRAARAHARTHQHPRQAAARHGRSVPALAGPSAGRVRSVVVQRTTGCRPGTLCGVKVTVHLAPSSASQVIGWRVGVARRCAKPGAWTPVTTVTAQPGWSQVFASSSVQLPKGGPLALVALTSTPARAQSRPVPVAGGSQSC